MFHLHRVCRPHPGLLVFGISRKPSQPPCRKAVHSFSCKSACPSSDSQSTTSTSAVTPAERVPQGTPPKTVESRPRKDPWKTYLSDKAAHSKFEGSKSGRAALHKDLRLRSSAGATRGAASRLHLSLEHPALSRSTELSGSRGQAPSGRPSGGAFRDDSRQERASHF